MKITEDQNNDGIRVAVVVDDNDIKDEVVPLLLEEFPKIYVIEADAAIAEFDRILPHVVLFACANVAAAESIYLSVYRLSKCFIASIHESIVLTSREDVKKSYELCRDGVFSDLVLFRPIYEPYRLLLSVYQAMDRVGIRSENNDQRGKFGSVASRLDGVDQGLNSTLEDVGELEQQIKVLGQQATHLLGQSFDDLAARIERSPKETGMQIISKNRAREVFNEFKSQEVRGVFEQTAAPIDKNIGDIARDVEGYRKQLSAASQDFVETSGLDKKRILVAEDDEFYLSIISDLLAREGYDVVSCQDGIVALAEISRKSFDLIICDISMPNLSGLELLEKLKSSFAQNELPVMMITGDRTQSSLMRCVELGVKDYIVKPFEKEDFVGRVSKVFGRASLE